MVDETLGAHSHGDDEFLRNEMKNYPKYVLVTLLTALLPGCNGAAAPVPFTKRWFGGHWSCGRWYVERTDWSGKEKTVWSIFD